jgi:hypothetical protein
MSQVKIKRQFRAVTATIATSTSSSTTVRMDDMLYAAVQVPALATSGAVLQVWGNSTDTGAFTQLYGSDGNAATITVNANGTNVATAYGLPQAAYGVPYIKLVTTSTNATTAAAVVMIKS